VLVTVLGNTNTAMAIVAANGGGIGTADTGDTVRSTVALAPNEKDKVLPRDTIQREFSKMNLHPTTGAMRSVSHDAEFATIATHYRFLQGHFPDLVVDVLPVLTRMGKQASFELAKTVANELANRGVRNVLLDSDARLQRGFASLPQDEEALDSKPLLRADVDALPELAFR
jgi:hypothetical protein